jgi:hypothetical protein
MKNLHILPTDKPSFGKYLVLNKEGILCIWNTNTMGSQKTLPTQHIYITSDEPFKKGDKGWLLENSNFVVNVCEFHCLYGVHGIYPTDKKIILTTDQDLIKDGVQAIDDEFLEWFVKNPSCEYVEIIKDRVFKLDEFQQREFYDNYKIIIPQEEPKQELDCPYDFTSRCTMGRCDCKPKQEKPCTQNVVDEAMKIVSKDVRQPKCVRDGLVQKQETLEETAERLFPKEKHPTSFETLRRAFISNAVRQQRRQETLEETGKRVSELVDAMDSNMEMFSITNQIDELGYAVSNMRDIIHEIVKILDVK